MEKKYQVFLSSTYADLKEERQEVIQGLLQLDCIPVGMEFFPAANTDQFTLIKNLIDDCDYYVLIVGGRYGSMNEEGISYTQLEYEYAVSKKIPVIAFLHKNPDGIPAGKTDKNQALADKLELFKMLVQKKMCKFWSTSGELGTVVLSSLIKLIKDNPRHGWIKSSGGDNGPEVIEELSRLSRENADARDQISKLEKQLNPPRDEEFQKLESALAKSTYGLLFNFQGSSEWEEPTEVTYLDIVEALGVDLRLGEPLHNIIRRLAIECKPDSAENRFLSDEPIPKNFAEFILLKLHCLEIIEDFALNDIRSWRFTEYGLAFYKWLIRKSFMHKIESS